MFRLRRSPVKTQVTCPACGNKHWEYAEANSTFCHACGHRIRLKEPEKQRAKRKMKIVRQKVHCLECQGPLQIPDAALSWQCHHCSSYLDLRDYTIDKDNSKTIKTYGTLTITSKGSYGGTKALVEDARIAGKVSGRIECRGTMTIDGHCRCSAPLEGETLHILPNASLETNQPLEFKNVKIEGRLNAKDLKTKEAEIAPSGRMECSQMECESLTAEPGCKVRASARTSAKE